MRLVETLSVAIVTGRRIGAVPLLLRAVVALGVLVAVLGTALPAWDVPNAYVVSALIFAVAVDRAPAPAGLVFLGLPGHGLGHGRARRARSGRRRDRARPARRPRRRRRRGSGLPAMTASAGPRACLRWAGPTA